MDRYTEAVVICKLLCDHGFPTMMAGGCVRDRLFGQDPKDYDLATVARPPQVMTFFETRGYRVVPVGVEHGTVLLVTEIQSLEITTLRRDVACDGRHAEVAFSNDFREDALRRDFTINALFEDHHGQIHDFVDGKRDMKQRHLRFVGIPAERIREDYLRILRYFRFLARLGWSARDDQLAAIIQTRAGLAQLSAERVHGELARLLASVFAPSAFIYMEEAGILPVLFPWYRADASATIARGLELLDSELTPRWFVFLYLTRVTWTEDEWSDALARLRFSKEEKRILRGLLRLVQLCEDHWTGTQEALRLLEKTPIQASHIHSVLFRDAIQVHPSPLIYRMLVNASHTGPEIPTDALLRIPPKERGQLVELIKIYWYLGECRDKTKLMDIMNNPNDYRERLCKGCP